MVKDGLLLHAQLAGMWKQEMASRPNLPLQFRDTNLALADFIRQGLDFAVTEFSLTTGRSPEGTLGWIAQARRITFYAPF